jgi:DNA-binding MarR family transcriptional regulator
VSKDQFQYRDMPRRDRIAVIRLNRAFRLLLSKYRRISTAQARTFLSICAEEGLTVSTLALKCGVEPFTISRHLRELGTRNRRGDTACGLVDVRDLELGDNRERYVFLSDQGVTLFRQMIVAFKGEPIPPIDARRSPAKTDASQEAHGAAPAAEGYPRSTGGPTGSPRAMSTLRPGNAPGDTSSES